MDWNIEQYIAYKKILKSVNGNEKRALFLNGEVGTRKLYLYNTLVSRICLKDQVVINVASILYCITSFYGGLQYILYSIRIDRCFFMHCIYTFIFVLISYISHFK